MATTLSKGEVSTKGRATIAEYCDSHYVDDNTTGSALGTPPRRLCLNRPIPTSLDWSWPDFSTTLLSLNSSHGCSPLPTTMNGFYQYDTCEDRQSSRYSLSGGDRSSSRSSNTELIHSVILLNLELFERQFLVLVHCRDVAIEHIHWHLCAGLDLCLGAGMALSARCWPQD